MIVFFVYNILIFNYKDTKNYRDYQLFKRISYPELRLLDNDNLSVNVFDRIIDIDGRLLLIETVCGKN